MWNKEESYFSYGEAHVCYPVTLTNGVPIETVSSMLGHTKITTTQIYAMVLENKVSEDMDKLEKKLFAK